MGKCPLCGDSRLILLKKYKIDDLRTLWLRSHNFDPFPTVDFPSVMSKLQCLQCSLISYDPKYVGDDVLYQTLSTAAWYYPQDKWEFQRALELIRKHQPKSVLEVGCGDGFFLEKIVSAVDYVEGIEFNKSAVDRCRQKGLNVADKKLSEIERQFEMIVLFQVLEHVPNPGDLIQQLARRLTADGMLVVAVPNPLGYMSVLDMNIYDMPPHHCTGWTKEAFSFVAQEYHLVMDGYEMQPLELDEFKEYISALFRNSGVHQRRGLKGRLIYFLQNTLVEIASPLIYVGQRREVVGHTQMSFFRKVH